MRKHEQALKLSRPTLHPKRASSPQGFADLFEEWEEQNLHKLEALGHMGKVPELAKLVALRDILPREVDDQVETQQ